MALKGDSILVEIAADTRALSIDMGKAERIVDDSAKRIGGNISSVFGGLAKAGRLFAGAAVIGGALEITGGIIKGLRGDVDALTDSLERLPFGIGGIASALKGLMFEIGGVNKQIAENDEATKQLDANMKRIRAEAALRKQAADDAAAKQQEQAAADEAAREKMREEIAADQERRRRATESAKEALQRERDDLARLRIGDDDPRARARLERDIRMREADEERERNRKRGVDPATRDDIRIAQQQRAQIEFEREMERIRREEARAQAERIKRFGDRAGARIGGFIGRIGEGVNSAADFWRERDAKNDRARRTQFRQVADLRSIAPPTMLAKKQDKSQVRAPELENKADRTNSLLERIGGFLQSGVVGVLAP